MAWMRDNKVALIDWPACSPDMNVMENVWKYLSDYVYDGPQFDTKDQLWEAVLDANERVQNEQNASLINLFTDFNSRLIQVIEKQGAEIPY